MVIRIGKVGIGKPFALAPMAGVNCAGFRLLCREYGAGLIYTQMYHCDFMVHKLENEGIEALLKFLNIDDRERPVAIQLIGSRPENMLKAALAVEKKADIIDINLGCSDPAIIRSGSGAYFTKHPEKIKDIVMPLVKKCSVPITAKIRIGYDPQSINGVRVAQELEEMGISAVAVHGRVAVQKFAGKANWEIIKHIKQKLSIPVIGNGDVRSSADAEEMFKRTGCDIVMIGRRAMGDPGIFARCQNKDAPAPAEIFRKFFDYYSRFDHNKSFNELKTHAVWSARRARLGPKKRNLMMRARTPQRILEIFYDMQARQAPSAKGNKDI